MFRDDALAAVENEFDLACQKFDKFNSPHEGLAVIEEEFGELKREVFKNPSRRNLFAMSKEATQVAAMALRFLIDCC